MGKPFTPERLSAIRRMRKARRLFKKEPLFAFNTLCMEYPGYTHEQFLDDLRYRRKPKRRENRSALVRYGRYSRMRQLLERYRNTEDINYAIQAQRLRDNMTKPYRVLVRVEGKMMEYGFSPLIPFFDIERLTSQITECRTESEVDTLVERFRKTANIL